MANVEASPNLEALPASPSRAQTLPSDAVLDALCSIFPSDEDGLHLRYGIAPGLSEAYRAAVDGAPRGQHPSCRTTLLS